MVLNQFIMTVVTGSESHLGFGFFEDINIKIYKKGFTLSLMRVASDNSIHRFKTNNDTCTLNKWKNNN